ncbi:CDK5 and ABL1 enzyme substrate 1 [Corvus kubaryi]|uniref:CDK5 and ABL1 enzyme substrate 1 n=1 Tax=Corvus kubaryi TaxID=68294 RepID=UPI001C059751|nr:CDK5 and ABL1 enzyme substrate 1 [Corvus kubaryi]
MGTLPGYGDLIVIPKTTGLRALDEKAIMLHHSHYHLSSNHLHKLVTAEVKTFACTWVELRHSHASDCSRGSSGRDSPGLPHRQHPSAPPGAAPRPRLSSLPIGHRQRLPQVPAPTRENQRAAPGPLARHGCIPVPLPVLLPVPQTGRAEPQHRVRCALRLAPRAMCREEEEDAFAAVQVPPAAFLGAAAAGSRGRLNSFTAGVLPAPFGRTSPQGSAGGSGELGQPGLAAAFELQRSRRRLISQRSSLETLEDIEENAPLRRCRTLSGSPRPKNFKKVHFIKNMRQHDTRNGRIVLISSRRSFCSIFSVLPYRDCTQVGDMKLDGGRQCHSTGVCLKDIIGLEGVELGADGKTVSYTQFLFPTNALGTRRNTIDSTSSFSQFRNASHRSLSLGRANSTQGSIDAGSDLGDFVEYDPNLLDDPQWPCGKHKRVLIFPSYMTTVIDYVKPSDLKKDMNETFKEKFPHIKLTLSKIRSLKREMRKLAQEECGFEAPTVAMAFVYFEKLALKGKLNKQNRKLCAGACVLLAAKIGSDLRKHEVKHLIDKLEEKFRLNRRELIAFEFPVLVALEFALHLPEHEVMPHYRRLVQNS